MSFGKLLVQVSAITVVFGQTSNQGSISCDGGSVSGYLGYGEEHYYSFEVPSNQQVYVENCDTDFDSTLKVLNSDRNTISYDYCEYGHDDCGSCSGSQEEFDMPLDAGSYYVQIGTWSSFSGGGYYELSVCCSDDYTCTNWASDYWWIWAGLVIFILIVVCVCCRRNGNCGNTANNGVSR